MSVHKILKDVYWLLKKMPNIREANVHSSSQHVTVRSASRLRLTPWQRLRQLSRSFRLLEQVVGDLHGQYSDLLHILDSNGMPSEKRLYVFNGDFVDRGPSSLQVILTLFVLQLAEPQYV